MNIYKERLERIERIANLKAMHYSKLADEEPCLNIITKLDIWEQVGRYFAKSVYELDNILSVWERTT